VDVAINGLGDRAGVVYSNRHAIAHVFGFTAMGITDDRMMDQEQTWLITP